MIIVDNALQAREASGDPIRVGMIGAGFMGRGLLNQIVHSVPGERTRRRLQPPSRQGDRCLPLRRGRAGHGRDTGASWRTRSLATAPAVTDDWTLLTRSPQIDALVDVTGAVEFGAHMVMDAFEHGKHVVLMNAELDATIGPILQVYAEERRCHPLRLRRRPARGRDQPVSATSRASA